MRKEYLNVSVCGCLLFYFLRAALLETNLLFSNEHSLSLKFVSVVILLLYIQYILYILLLF